jgi:dTDP-4-dehydrorhamnose reductase
MAREIHYGGDFREPKYRNRVILYLSLSVLTLSAKLDWIANSFRCGLRITDWLSQMPRLGRVLRRSKLYSSFEAGLVPDRVLILGASGYLGQFLQVHLAKHFADSVVGLSSKDVDFDGPYQEFEAAIKGLGDFDLVVNCAAISVPGECAKNPSRADAVNIPRHLIKYLLTLQQRPLLVHMSTDQVYDGHKSMWSESDEAKPLNDYGRTKRAAEELIERELIKNYAILRSSIIVGPPPPLKSLSRPLFLEFILNTLEVTHKVPQFFFDEWRCPVSVYDVVDVIKALWTEREALERCGEVFNMGGSTRVSREDMARTVALVYGLDGSRIEGVSTATVNRGVASPADISMDSSKLQDFIGFRLCSFRTTIKQVSTVT